jgi:hypothetical protein
MLAGTLLSLSPVTLTFGITVLALTAIVSLATIVIEKVLYFRAKRREHLEEEQRHEIVEIECKSTASIISSLRELNPAKPHGKNRAHKSLSESALFCKTPEFIPARTGHFFHHAGPDKIVKTAEVKTTPALR